LQEGGVEYTNGHRVCYDQEKKKKKKKKKRAHLGEIIIDQNYCGVVS